MPKIVTGITSEKLKTCINYLNLSVKVSEQINMKLLLIWMNLDLSYTLFHINLKNSEKNVTPLHRYKISPICPYVLDYVISLVVITYNE